MLTLYLTDEQEMILQSESQKAGVSVNEYALARLFENKKEKPVYLVDLIKDFPISSFKDKDPLQIKREMRDEWD